MIRQWQIRYFNNDNEWVPYAVDTFDATPKEARVIARAKVAAAPYATLGMYRTTKNSYKFAAEYYNGQEVA